MKARRTCYGFGQGTADGSGELKELLGGKGAGLAEMSLLGIPVPPGFTITTEVCNDYHRNGHEFPAGLLEQVKGALAIVEEGLDQRFASSEVPLLLSVRSGSPISMPGMMDTVLNLGLNDAIVEAQSGEDQRFYRDCYRRLLAMYGEVVLSVPAVGFSDAMRAVLDEHGVSYEQELSDEGLARVVSEFKRVIADSDKVFPQEPFEQLSGAIAAVFDSWHNRRAREYRKIQGISESLGTGVTVQAMVFGNRGEDCATGVAFTRNPSTGDLELFGEFLVNAQGEDVVAGTHTPRPIGDGSGAADGECGLRASFPEAYDELERVCGVLERHFRNMQDLEFTIQGGKLFMLQTRAGKRSGPAAVRIAVDMVRERLIDRREALRRVEPQHLVQMLAPEFDSEARRIAHDGGDVLATGLAAGPGAAAGRIAFTAERAAEMSAQGPVILVRSETSPEDIVGMHAAAGILTTRGGMTSHAAVVARGLGKPCIVGASSLLMDHESGELIADGRTLREGDELSIDGSRGEVLVGALPTESSAVLDAVADGDEDVLLGLSGAPAVSAFFLLLQWADRERRLGVRANADTPEDARVAVQFGAQGIGLCRTEHMFFEEERIPWVRRMILAAEDGERAQALQQLLPMQQSDFEGILDALDGRPVTIRLLDPPLHEFLPHGKAELNALAKHLGMKRGRLRNQIESLTEVNPMLGHRGCRLGMTAPEIYDMQVEALARAACSLLKQGRQVRPEIMIPLTGVEEELSRLRARVEEVLARVFDAEGVCIEIPIGTMIEVPRAALVADQMAQHADFFSFGTNDLTQMTYGYSRDDVGHFLPRYLEDEVVPFDPFERIDEQGVGELVKIASRRGRMARPELKLGVCGEHGGEPHSIEFFERCGLDYVSCSPYRVPIARLAAARSHLAFGAGGFAEALEKD